MTQESLIQCLATIDAHFGKHSDTANRKAEMYIYSSILGTVPDEIALKALPDAFAVCRYQSQFIVDWCNAIRALQASSLPSANESWEQTRRVAKRIQDNLYYARSGGYMTHSGKITPCQLREENRKAFAELPSAVQAWAGSPDDLAELFERPPADIAQFIKPGFMRAVREANASVSFKSAQEGLPGDNGRTALEAHQSV